MRIGLLVLYVSSALGGVMLLHSLIVQFQKHHRGEVFALDKTDTKGRSTISSTILDFDGKPRVYTSGGSKT